MRFIVLVSAALSVSLAFGASIVSPLPKKPPVPADNPITSAKIVLGKQLYFDPRLSKDGSVSCNSCHNVMGSGTDNKRFSVGVGGKLGGRNSPTVWNAAFLSVQFWDGRAKNLEEQAKGPLTNPVEMAMPNHQAVVDRVKKIPGYVEQFKKVFSGADPVNIDNIAKAIATYERTLITPNSPFDQYLAGKPSAISKKAVQGYKKVQEVGCMACHSGVNFAGPNLPEGIGFYQKFPTFTDNPYVSKYKLTEDTGRHVATKQDQDKYMWRVPTWRNIALTAPYLHNGSVNDLSEVVRLMAKTQLNRDVTDQDVEEIVAFLETLNGKIPEQSMPILPQTSQTSIVD